MENSALYKMKLAVLWLVFFSVMVISPILELYLPGFLEESIPMTAEIILSLAIMMLISPAMAVLSLTLKDLTNRWLNIIVGVVLAGATLFFPIEYLAKQDPHYTGLILVGIAGFVFAALIVWYAWKWPKQQ